MSKLHLVFGGRAKDPQGLDFDMNTIQVVGIYDSYAAAEDAVNAVSKRPVAAGAVVAGIVAFIAREPLMDLAKKLADGAKGKSRRRRKAPDKEKTEATE